MRAAEAGWWPGSAVASALAALTTWATLSSWSGFVEWPGRFLAPALGGLLLVALTGYALRALRLHPALVALAQVAALVVWATQRWAGDVAFGGVLPTQESVRALAARLGDAAVVAQEYSAPVPADVPGMDILLILAGCGAGVAVDFFACGLRRVPLAGLPLLALYTAPVSILPQGIAWWMFALGAVTFLVLLSHDQGQRLSRWGRHVGVDGTTFDSVGTAVGPASVRASARRIGLTATGLAVVVPLFIPTFGSSLLPGGGTGGDGDGDAVSITNPLVDLRRDLVRGRDVDLLSVTTATGDPTYLRTSVLDEFDGTAWKPSGRDIPVEQRADGPVPLPSGIATGVSRRRTEFRITVDGPFRSQWLPTPYPVTNIDAAGDWRYDTETLDFVSAAENLDAQGMDYRLTALELSPRAASLVDAGPPPEDLSTRFTELPEVPDRVTELARQVTAETESDFEAAVRLQQWFREDGGFTYSLDRAPGSGVDELLTFLSPENRIGYCEQFAASMSVMGRALGIPARVAVGFLRPERVADQTYVYSAHDLHAWPELYFEGAGWLRFEPTPQARADQVPPYTDASLGADEPTQVPSDTPSDQLLDPRERLQDRLDPGAGAFGDTGGGGSGSGFRTGLGFLLGALLLLLVPRSGRALLRRRRWAEAAGAGAAEVAWGELRATATDLRLPWDDGTTLRARARGLAAAFGAADSGDGGTAIGRRGAAADPEATRALERIVRAVERSRYARPAADDTVDGAHASTTLADLRSDVAACEEALRRGSTPARRRRARWLPASLLTARSGRESRLPAPLAAAGMDRVT